MRTLALCLLLLTACTLPPLPGNAAPIVKIGLIAPFEGLGRPLGYSVLPAVKIAVAEANASGALGRYRVALVALNDDAYPPSAVQQVKALALDPDVLGVLGPWSSDTAAAALPALQGAGLPALVAAPMEASGPGTASLCPSPAGIASAMLAEASGLAARNTGALGPTNALAQAIVAGGGPAAGTVSLSGGAADLIFHTGDAAAAADDWLRLRAAGWDGVLLGGPDVARGWFLGRIGVGEQGSGGAGGQGNRGAGEIRVEAVACAAPGESPARFSKEYRAQAGQAPDHEARLAYAGARLLLDALASDIGTRGQPTRDGVAAGLAQRPIQPALARLHVLDGQWEPAP